MESGGKDDHNYAKRNGDPLNECPDCRGNFTTTEHLKRHIKTEHMSDANKLVHSSENPTETPEYRVERDDVEIGGKVENNAAITPVESANDTEIQEKNCKMDTEIPKQKSEKIIRGKQNRYQSESNIVRFKCLRCDKSFKSMTNLSAHNVIHEEAAVYRCIKCGFCFTHLSLLTNHLNEAHGQVSPDGLLEDQMNTNLGKTLYQCPLCRLSFTERKTRSLHKCQNQRMLTKQKYFCGDCGKPYKTISYLRTHMLTKHRKSVFWCEKCGDDFKFKSDLELHILRMHADTSSFVCGHCGKSFTSLTLLKEHEFMPSAVQTDKCADLICECHYCGKLFTTKDLLKTHMKLHCKCTPIKNYLKPEDWPFKCEECDSRFRYFYELKVHTSRKHTILKPLKCPECEKCFASQVILNLHMKTHTTVKHLLEDHMNTHLPICTQQDSDCKNETSLSGNNAKTPIPKVSAGNKVKKLKDRQSPEKDEEIPAVKPKNDVDVLKAQGMLLTAESTLCPASSVQFSRPENVKTQLHSANRKTNGVAPVLRVWGKINGKRREQWKLNVERRIPCPDCDKTFTTWNLLQKHRKLHQAECLYKCGMCESRFRNTNQLKKHKLRVHKDDEPFECGKCGMGFASIQILTRHMQTHLDFKCNHIGCNQELRTLGQLTQHQEKHSTGQQANLGNSGAGGDESKQYPCLYCKGKFDTFAEAQTHIKSHGELQLEPVEITSELNMSNTNLNSAGSDTDDNMNSHTDILTDSDFDASMKTHITEPMDCFHSVSADEHNYMDCKKEDSNPFPCLKYNSFYNINSDLEAHEKVQNDSESTKDYDYLHHFNYDNSMHFDDDLKPFPCLACHKSFTSNLDLEAHLRTHIHVNSKDSCVINGEFNFTDADVIAPDGAKCDMPSELKDHSEINKDETPHYNSDPGIPMKTHRNVKSEDSCVVNGELNVRL